MYWCRVNVTKSGPAISSASQMPLKDLEAVRRCPTAINDALLKSHCSKSNIKNMPRWISEGSLRKFVAYFQKYPFQRNPWEYRLYKNTLFLLSDIKSYVLKIFLFFFSCGLIFICLVRSWELQNPNGEECSQRPWGPRGGIVVWTTYTLWR